MLNKNSKYRNYQSKNIVNSKFECHNMSVLRDGCGTKKTHIPSIEISMICFCMSALYYRYTGDVGLMFSPVARPALI